MSVFSTRFALFFGTGAAKSWRDQGMILVICSGWGVHTVRVLSDIEFTKDHDRFVSQIPTVSLISWVFWMGDPDCQVR